MALSGTLTAKFKVTHTKTLDMGNVALPLGPLAEKVFNFANGILINQADLMFSDQRTLADAASEELDLAGTLVNAFGDTITFARIKGIFISCEATNTGNLLVGGAASNAFVNWVSDATDKIIVRPDGVLMVFAPDADAYPVTAGTGDKLKLEHDGTGSDNLVYNIVLIGASA